MLQVMKLSTPNLSSQVFRAKHAKSSIHSTTKPLHAEPALQVNSTTILTFLHSQLVFFVQRIVLIVKLTQLDCHSAHNVKQDLDQAHSQEFVNLVTLNALVVLEFLLSVTCVSCLSYMFIQTLQILTTKLVSKILTAILVVEFAMVHPKSIMMCSMEFQLTQ